MRMKRKVWVKRKDVEYLRENINSKSNKELADHIGMGTGSLSRVLRRYKIKRDPEFQKELMSHKGEDHPNWQGGLKQNNYQYTKKQRDRYPEKVAARQKVKRAIESGVLVKPDTCEDCGKLSNDIHGHHKDYSKPLNVNWLCRRCHRERHGGTH